MDSSDLLRIAERMLADYDARTPGLLFQQEDFQLAVEAAYQVQFAVARLRLARGETVAGYKIGCVSTAIRRQLGLDSPVFGHVWGSEVYAHDSQLPVERFANLAVEGELAVRVADEDGRIAAVFPVIELHNQVFRQRPTSAELIANNAIHAGVVLPAAVSAPGPGPARMTVLRNGEPLGSAHASAFAGGPAEAVERVRQHLRHWGLNLQPGQIVLTGAVLPLYPVARGDRIQVAAGGATAAASFH